MDTPPRQNQQQRQGPINQEAKRSAAAGVVATHLKDGKKLCPEFQKGRCEQKKPSCKEGIHKCANTTSMGRVCGMSVHAAKD